MINKTKGFEINLKNGVAEILIYDSIGPWPDQVSAKSIVESLNLIKNVKDINLKINSPGGNATEGFAIYNAFVNHSANVNVQIDGLAASVASLIAMAGDTIAMNENALLMIHDPFMISMGSAKDLRKGADLLDMVKDNIIKGYQGRVDLSSSELSKMMDEETWFNAESALKVGFVDEVIAGKEISNSFNLKTFNFKNVPDSYKQKEEKEPVTNWQDILNFDISEFEKIKPEIKKEEKKEESNIKNDIYFYKQKHELEMMT